MNRRAFLGTAAGALLAPAGAIAQPAARTWRIGYLSLVSGDLPQYRPWVASFRKGLRELGYAEGTTSSSSRATRRATWSGLAPSRPSSSD
jgi:hypothetical protein